MADLRASAFRALPAAARLRRVTELTNMVRQLALTGLRRRHPRATEPELQQMLVASLYGRAASELMTPPSSRRTVDSG